jgi:hypothetical protein
VPSDLREILKFFFVIFLLVLYVNSYFCDSYCNIKWYVFKKHKHISKHKNILYGSNKI